MAAGEDCHQQPSFHSFHRYPPPWCAPRFPVVGQRVKEIGSSDMGVLLKVFYKKNMFLCAIAVILYFYVVLLSSN